jgi:hypothetical protein
MRSIRLAPALALVGSVLAFTACGDDADDDDDDDDVIDGGGDIDAGIDAPPAPVTLDEICDEEGLFVDLFSQFIQCNPLVGTLLGGTPSGVELSAGCFGQFQDYIDDGTVTLGDSAAAAACLAYVDGLTCADLEILDPGPCGDLFLGTVALDGECEIDEQCIGNAYCAESKGGGCGTCTVQVADGEVCVDDAECINDHCRLDQSCGPLSDVGGPCGGDDDCVGDAYCSDLDECTASVGDGDDCTAPKECGFPFSGLYCNPDDGTCAAQSAVGEPCNDGLACDLFDFETCDAADTGECLAASVGGIGDPCGFFLGAKCALGLMCTDLIGGGECFSPGAVGAACDVEDPTAGCDFLLECIEGACAYRDYSGECPVVD